MTEFGEDTRALSVLLTYLKAQAPEYGRSEVEAPDLGGVARVPPGRYGTAPR